MQNICEQVFIFLQDAFRYLDLEPDKYGIQIAKKLIELSPANHFARNYIDTENFGFETKDLTFEAGFVDTFFNARDIAYDIPELRSLIENSGAYFQNWLIIHFIIGLYSTFQQIQKLIEDTRL